MNISLISEVFKSYKPFIFQKFYYTIKTGDSSDDIKLKIIKDTYNYLDKRFDETKSISDIYEELSNKVNISYLALLDNEYDLPVYAIDDLVMLINLPISKKLTSNDITELLLESDNSIEHLSSIVEDVESIMSFDEITRKYLADNSYTVSNEVIHLIDQNLCVAYYLDGINSKTYRLDSHVLFMKSK